MSVAINGAGSITGIDQGFNVTSGSVGIGTDNPITKLVVNSGTTNLATQIVSDDAEVFLAFKDGDSTGNQQVQIGGVGNNFVAYAGGNERLRITSAGNVGINETNPIGDLSITGANGSSMEFQPDIVSGTNRITNYNRSTSTYKAFRLDASQHEFLISGSERLRILSTGTVNIGDQGLGDEYLSSTVKIRKDQNSVTRLSLRNENSGSGSASAIQVGAYGNSWMLQCGSAANDSNAFTIRVDGSANSNTGTEKLRVTTAGLVGIATAVPSYRLDIGDGVTDPAGGNQLRVNASGDYIFALQRQSNASFSIRNNSTGIVHLNTQNSKILSLGVSSGNSSGSIEDDVRIDSNGHLTIVDGNLVVANGHGIDFSAASNASGMSSELLDDYEEGTWTPELLGGSSNPSLTYSAQSGGYEKIGSLVHLSFFMHVSAVNSQGSGYLELHGLPYTPTTSPLGASEVPALVLQTQPFTDGKGANKFAFVRTVGGSSRMFVGYRDLTNGNAIIPSQGGGNISTGYFIGHITYRAS